MKSFASHKVAVDFIEGVEGFYEPRTPTLVHFSNFKTTRFRDNLAGIKRTTRGNLVEYIK